MDPGVGDELVSKEPLSIGLLHAKDKPQLELKVLEVGLVKESLDVVHRETHQQVQGDYGHKNKENNEKEVGHGSEGNVAGIQSDVAVVKLPRHHDGHFEEGELNPAERLLVGEQDMEAQGKGDQEDDDDDGDFEEGVEDIVEDGDVLPQDRDLPHVDEEVDPGEGEHHGADLPHPALGREGEQCAVMQRKSSTTSLKSSELSLV